MGYFVVLFCENTNLWDTVCVCMCAYVHVCVRPLHLSCPPRPIRFVLHPTKNWIETQLHMICTHADSTNTTHTNIAQNHKHPQESQKNKDGQTLHSLRGNKNCNWKVPQLQRQAITEHTISHTTPLFFLTQTRKRVSMTSKLNLGHNSVPIHGGRANVCMHEVRSWQAYLLIVGPKDSMLCGTKDENYLFVVLHVWHRRVCDHLVQEPYSHPPTSIFLLLSFHFGEFVRVQEQR